MPKGMAVTSARPVSRARRRASHVYQRSPASTPSAVPGNDPVEDEIRREAEHADQQAGEHHQVREVVDGEPEERVDVARPRTSGRRSARAGSESITDRPARSAATSSVGARRAAGRRRPSAGGSGRARAAPGRWPGRARRAPRTTRSASAPRRPRGRSSSIGGDLGGGVVRAVEREPDAVGAALAGPAGVDQHLDARRSRAWRASGRSPRARRRSRDSRWGCSGSSMIAAVAGPRPPRAPARAGGVAV